MEDKIYLYTFTFIEDSEVDGISFLKYQRIGTPEIEFATSIEQAKIQIENIITSIKDNYVYDLYKKGILELNIHEITLIETQHFMYEK